MDVDKIDSEDADDYHNNENYIITSRTNLSRF